jgi:hypothetical protein
LKQFLLFKTIRKTIKSSSQYWAETGARLRPMGRGGLLHAVGRNSREAAAWRLGPARKTARAARGNARAPHARGVVTVHGPRVRCRARRRRGGTGRWQGAAGEHQWGLRVAPGKKIGGGAHPIGGASRGGGSGTAQRGGGPRQWSGHGGRRRWGPSSTPRERESEVRWGRD